MADSRGLRKHIVNTKAFIHPPQSFMAAFYGQIEPIKKERQCRPCTGVTTISVDLFPVNVDRILVPNAEDAERFKIGKVHFLHPLFFGDIADSSTVLGNDPIGAAQRREGDQLQAARFFRSNNGRTVHIERQRLHRMYVHTAREQQEQCKGRD